MHTTNHKTNIADSVWIPIGVALGAAFGLYLDSVSMGMAIGLTAGASISMFLEYRHGKRSLIWPAVGAFALLWIVTIALLERA